MISEQNTGLKQQDVIDISHAASRINNLEALVLFGSRAKGNFRKGSDVDLAIKGPSVTYESVVQLAVELNETSPMPYFFDVLHYDTLQEPDLKAHIDRVGIEIYSRLRSP
ncbi:nucleotidyltransferase domain-containing protein [Salinispirillum marinum]|uniref:Nucleotidyltransferase domain-containing protein n=2 Tax=Saccharospirillaceae TaxID=255527 RepID=A0ABV8BDA4_9GAMM